jgi:hypothetical protein
VDQNASPSRAFPFAWLAGAVCRHGSGRSLADALVPKLGAPRGTYSLVLSTVPNFHSLTPRWRFCLGVGVQSRPIWQSEKRRKRQRGRVTHARRVPRPIEGCPRTPSLWSSICAHERDKNCCSKLSFGLLSGRHAVNKAASPTAYTAGPNCPVHFCCMKSGPAARIIAFTRKHRIFCVGMHEKMPSSPRATQLFGSRSLSKLIR